jgi:hypothetical protein
MKHTASVWIQWYQKSQVMMLRGLTFSAGQTCYSERSRNHLDVASSVTERMWGLFLHQAPHEGLGSQNSVLFYDRCPRVWERTAVVIRMYAARKSWGVHLMLLLEIILCIFISSFEFTNTSCSTCIVRKYHMKCLQTSKWHILSPISSVDGQWVYMCL